MRPEARATLAAIAGTALAAAIALPVPCANAAAAQPYPVRPIRIVVPQSAAGSTDLVARAVAQRLGEALKENIVVDNRPGAGSLHGTDLVAKSAPDGYTLLAVAASFTINPSLRKNLPFDPVRDFAPISQLVSLPHILVVHPSVAVKSVKELVALAKAKPGQLNYGSSGVATSTHLAAELFRYMTGTDMVNVPYKGGAPGMTALLGGQVHLYFATISTALPHIRTGKLRALGVTSAKRSTAAPEFTTIAEAGVPGYQHTSWVGMLAPAKTPRPIITRLNSEVVGIVQAEQMKTLLLREGLEADGSTPEEFAQDIRTEIAKWMKLTKAAGIKAD
ncbi:MAG: tripartite tricarboxylate transporter substrate binding protein [Betaproteobacteria bacterium]|nr:tripartite tricarboxylate transporter substrate binding protein [Betaproteobacteria bacterium]